MILWCSKVNKGLKSIISLHLSILEEGLIEEQVDFRIDNRIVAIATSNYIQPDHQSRFLHSVVIDGNDQRKCV